MTSKDRCLTKLEELELENQSLKVTNKDLLEINQKLINENLEYSIKFKTYQTAIERWEQANED